MRPRPLTFLAPSTPPTDVPSNNRPATAASFFTTGAPAPQRGGLCSIVLLSLSLLAGCSNGQIGGEVKEPDDGGLSGGEGGDGCESAETIPLAFDEMSTLGFSAEQLAANIAGSHETTLAWGVEEGYVTVELTPEAGEGMITVVVRVDEKSARFVDLEPASSGEDRGTLIGDMASSCSDVVLVDAQIEVTTDNGALNETFEVTLSAATPNYVSTRIELEPGSLDGSFDVEVSGPAAKAEQTALQLAFTPGTVSGRISGLITTNDGQAASAGGVTYGHFPLDNCETGALVGQDTAFATKIFEAFDGLTELSLAWPGEEPTNLDLGLSPGRLCFEPSVYGSADRVVVQLPTTATSADGRIDGTWQLEGAASLAVDGTVQEAHIFRNGSHVQTFEPAAFEVGTGISGFSFDPESKASFSFEVGQDQDGHVQGDLTILEIVPADCATEPVESPDGGMSAPGCAGDDVRELATAVITDR